MKTIGEYYKEKVLSLPESKREQIYLPISEDKVKVEKNLFNYRIYYKTYGRKNEKFIECHSEEEARYLKIFMEAGVSSVYVPKDKEYLKSILPELERLKKRIDEIIEEELSKMVLRPRIKKQALRSIWLELASPEA